MISHHIFYPQAPGVGLHLDSNSTRWLSTRCAHSMSYASLPSSCSSNSTKRSLVALSTATAAAARERWTIPVAQLIFPFPLEPTHDSGDEKEERRVVAPLFFAPSSPLPLPFIPPRLILFLMLILGSYRTPAARVLGVDLVVSH